jgi:hypothetical protein
VSQHYRHEIELRRALRRFDTWPDKSFGLTTQRRDLWTAWRTWLARRSRGVKRAV